MVDMSAKIYRKFKLKDGTEVILRQPKMSDVDGLLNYINSLVKEGVSIAVNKKLTRKEETKWLRDVLKKQRKKEGVCVVAEVGNKIIAFSDINKEKGAMSHVGKFGIAVCRDYRRIGIGKELMKSLIKESRKLGIKILYLGVFAENKAALKLYRKMGFKQCGKIPRGARLGRKYMDYILMSNFSEI